MRWLTGAPGLQKVVAVGRESIRRRCRPLRPLLRGLGYGDAEVVRAPRNRGLVRIRAWWRWLAFFSK